MAKQDAIYPELAVSTRDAASSRATFQAIDRMHPGPGHQLDGGSYRPFSQAAARFIQETALANNMQER